MPRLKEVESHCKDGACVQRRIDDVEMLRFGAGCFFWGGVTGVLISLLWSLFQSKFHEDFWRSKCSSANKVGFWGDEFTAKCMGVFSVFRSKKLHLFDVILIADLQGKD